MPLEKIAKRKTLADGYRANGRLRNALAGYAAFYVVQILLLVGLLAVHSSNTVEDISLVLNGLGYTLPITVAGVLALTYALIAIVLTVAARYDIRWLSAVVSMLSFLFHLAVALGLAVVTALMIYSVASSADRLPQPMRPEIIAHLPNGFSDGVTTFLWVVGIIAALQLIIWFLLLLTVVSRSLRSFRAALRGVPGLYKYGYGTQVFSSTGMESEMEFLSDALSRARGYSRGEAEEIIEEEDRYLIRFASRNGELVAAALHELPDYNLIALFGGEGSKSVNIEVLLEDSFHIQKLKVAEARASLRTDRLIEEIASKDGWTVEIRNSLMDLHRA